MYLLYRQPCSLVQITKHAFIYFTSHFFYLKAESYKNDKDSIIDQEPFIEGRSYLKFMEVEDAV